MKTKTINQQPRLCESTDFGFSLPLLWARLRFTTVSFSASALRATLATLRALVTEVNSNDRLFVGLVLLLVVAPVSSKAYVFFEGQAVDRNWFHTNYYYLFINLGPTLKDFFGLLGIFFLFPARVKVSYIISAPLGFTAADLLNKYYATSNAEFVSTPSFLITSLLIGLLLGVLLSADYFLYKHHHIKRKYWAHIVGIIKTPGIPAEQKMKILEGEIKSVETNFYSIY